jgi:hypothetical protein
VCRNQVAVEVRHVAASTCSLTCVGCVPSRKFRQTSIWYSKTPARTHAPVQAKPLTGQRLRSTACMTPPANPRAEIGPHGPPKNSAVDCTYSKSPVNRTLRQPERTISGRFWVITFSERVVKKCLNLPWSDLTAKTRR